MLADQFSPFPVLGTPFIADQYVPLDLSSQNQLLSELGLEAYLSNTLLPDQIGYGGYLEHRTFYLDSPLFQEEARTLHLGIDLWAPANTPVYAPLDATIHSLANNANYLDYGPTLILHHQSNGSSFYTLYGHLTLASLHNKIPGQRISKGEELCRIGDPPVNGQWPPHLHLQCIIDLEGHQGDYPGVAFPDHRDKYSRNCPDPSPLIGLI